ncbi:MAG TPA: COX15/CtaA family protein, partial [Phnomibacter sp.]|nr:COX15/CtaA family protein [Phnomibacter sp.]
MMISRRRMMDVASGQTEIGMKMSRNDRWVAYWLLAGVIMVVVQIAIGGITRLTGSGLSITEWEVVTGALPPMNDADWMAEFGKYRATPQFHLLNSDFSLSDFKFIYFWEWFHRLWARIIGLVFAGGFIFFLATRRFRKPMVFPLLVLFLLGGLQGFIGWIMVASGLTGDAVYVKPTRLALHFILALVLLAYTFWFYLHLRIPPFGRSPHRPIFVVSAGMMGAMVLQLMYGALMAGHKAASAAATWPDINGSLFNPPGLYKADHGLLNFIDNRIMVHFIHRGLAYLLLAAGVYLTWLLVKHTRKGTLLHAARWMPIALIGLQMLLGIFSVLSGTGIVPNRWGAFEWLAQLHQLTG